MISFFKKCKKTKEPKYLYCIKEGCFIFTFAGFHFCVKHDPNQHEIDSFDNETDRVLEISMQELKDPELPNQEIPNLKEPDLAFRTTTKKAIFCTEKERKIGKIFYQISKNGKNLLFEVIDGIYEIFGFFHNL